jgi:integrase
MELNLLSDRALKSARPTHRGTERMIRDGGGLWLRVRGVDSKAWVFVYEQNGRRRKVGLGTYPDVSLAEARSLAAKQREALRSGAMPRRASDSAPASVRDLFERWRDVDLAHRRKDKGAGAEAVLEKHVLSRIGHRPLADVRKGDVAELLDRVRKAGLDRTVGSVLGLLRQMFRFGVVREYVTADPTAALQKRDFVARDAERERVLSEDELRELARRLAVARRVGPKGRERSAPALPLAAQHALWIMLGTLARVGELSKARWEHVDTEAGTWLVPADNSKNGREHLVHLSPFASAHFEALRELSDKSAWVLPSRDGESHVATQAITKQVRDRQRRGKQRLRQRAHDASLLLPGGEWTSHDLRRTGASLMQSLGVAPHVIERCLNHAEESRVVRTYQRHDYMEERRAAFVALGAKLGEIVK